MSPLESVFSAIWKILHKDIWLTILQIMLRVKGLLTGSLILQMMLLILAPYRKQTSNSIIMFSVWMAYLGSDYLSKQAVGLISRQISKSWLVQAGDDRVPSSATHPDLLTFWAPFLLIHLGGPDSITALALEDNDLWVRSILQLGTQLIVIGRIYVELEPRKVSSWATTFIFYAGVIKYSERAMSFFHARLAKFRSTILCDLLDPSPKYNKLMERYGSSHGFESTTTNQIVEVNDTEEEEIKLKEVEVVRDAYMLFEKYKGVFVDLIFSYTDRLESRAYFLKRTEEQAFDLIEIELNLTFDMFYTKLMVTRKAMTKYFRLIVLCLEVLSLLFWFSTKKSFFKLSEVRLTYALLIGAIAVDVVSFVRLMFSDWQIAHIPKGSKTRTRIFNYLLSFRKRTWGRFRGKKEATLTPWFRRIFTRRWSESISQFNLMNLCFDARDEWVERFFEISKLFGLLYVTKKWFSNDLRGFIFRELKYKSKIAMDPREVDKVCSSRGDWVLRSMDSADFDSSSFNPWTIMVEYDESLLLWHIATEISYQQQETDVSHQLKLKWYNSLWACLTSRKHNNAPPPPHTPPSRIPEENHYREFSKTISDYMMYLLIMQPQMMSAVSGKSELRYKDTCAEAKKFFKRTSSSTSTNNLTRKKRYQEACNRMFTLNMNANPEEIKTDDKSKSVMFNALCLVKKLNEVHDSTNNKWEVIAKVWVELLCYTATHIRPSAHAAQLKQGGELITLVWLLMVHLGLGNQFRISEAHLRPKLHIPE